MHSHASLILHSSHDLTVQLTHFFFNSLYSSCLPALVALDEACQSLQAQIALPSQQSAKNYPLAASNAPTRTALHESLRLQYLSIVYLIGARNLRTAFSHVPRFVRATQPDATKEPLLQSPMDVDAAEKDEQQSLKDRDDDGDENSNVGDTDSAPETKTTHTHKATSHPAADETPLPVEFVRIDPIISSKLRLKLFHWSQALGIYTWHWKLVLHMVVMYILAIVFTVVPQITDNIDHHGFWFIITVVTISDNTSGATLDNSLLRIAGTLIGSIGVCMCMGFGYIANGYTFEGFSTGRRIVLAGITSVWIAIFEAYFSKCGVRYTKLFNIAKVSTLFLARNMISSVNSFFLPYILSFSSPNNTTMSTTKCNTISCVTVPCPSISDHRWQARQSMEARRLSHCHHDFCHLHRRFSPLCDVPCIDSRPCYSKIMCCIGNDG